MANELHWYQITLAERDAEIADLRDNLQIVRGSRDELRTQNQALMTENVALRKRVAEADQIVRAGEAERKALAAQVANLRRIVAERGLKVTELEKWEYSLLAQVAELQAWKDAVPVDAIAEWWQLPANWTGYNHAQYDAWYQAVKQWVRTVKPK